MFWRWFIGSLALGNLLAWSWVLFATAPPFAIYFLSVGQGDSELIRIGPVDILVDGGPDATILQRLSHILPANDRYIDVVILTHPHLDHFGGLIDVLKQYHVGLLIESGRKNITSQYQTWEQMLSATHVRRVVLGRGDRLRYADLFLSFLSPSPDLRGKEIHDDTLVFMLTKNNLRGLFTGDINFRVEQQLIDRYHTALAAQLLKVSHHGSNNSTSDEFLRAVRPAVAVIEVGKRNPYGHPKPALLDRLAHSGVVTYRTDRDGTIKVILDEQGKLVIGKK